MNQQGFQLNKPIFCDTYEFLGEEQMMLGRYIDMYISWFQNIELVIVLAILLKEGIACTS